MARSKMISDNDDKSPFLEVLWFGGQVTPGRILGCNQLSLKELSPGFPPPFCSSCQVASLPGKIDLSWLFYYKARGSARAVAKPVRLLGHRNREGGGCWVGKQDRRYSKWSPGPQLGVGRTAGHGPIYQPLALPCQGLLLPRGPPPGPSLQEKLKNQSLTQKSLGVRSQLCH